MKQILWSRQASEQLAAAYDFVVEDNPSAAEKQVEMILRAVEQLVDFPEMGRPGRVHGTRELVIPGNSLYCGLSLERGNCAHSCLASWRSSLAHAIVASKQQVEVPGAPLHDRVF